MVRVFTYRSSPTYFVIEKFICKSATEQKYTKRDVQATFVFNMVKNVSKGEIKTTTVYAKNNATKQYAEVASIFLPLKLH